MSNLPLTAFGEYVIIRRAPPSERTKGGIILPDSAQEKIPVGIVEHVGPGVEVTAAIEAGQRVLYWEGSAQCHKVEGDGERFVVHYQCILALVREDMPEGI